MSSVDSQLYFSFVTCSDNVSYFERVVRVALDYCEHLWVDGSGDGREAVWDLIY